jgi:hypothetical protein
MNPNKCPRKTCRRSKPRRGQKGGGQEKTSPDEPHDYEETVVRIILVVALVFITIGFFSCAIASALNPGKGQNMFKSLCKASVSPVDLVNKIYDLMMAEILAPLVIAILPYAADAVGVVSTKAATFLTGAVERMKITRLRYKIKTNLDSAASNLKEGKFTAAEEDLAKANDSLLKSPNLLKEEDNITRTIDDFLDLKVFKAGVEAEKNLLKAEESGADAAELLKNLNDATKEIEGQMTEVIETIGKELL